MSDKTAAFEICDPIGGHRWKVYANGEIEGFVPGLVIINRIPALLLKAAEEAQRIRAEAAINNTPERVLDSKTKSPPYGATF